MTAPSRTTLTTAGYIRSMNMRHCYSMTDDWGSSHWSRADKLQLLDIWEETARNGTPARFLSQIGASHDLLLKWREEADAGTLADDVEPLPADTSIADLARDFRSIILQHSPRIRVHPDSLAGPVIFDSAGRRRRDYLARTRAALTAVLDATANHPSIVMGVRGVDPTTALAVLRDRWGLDALPATVEEAAAALAKPEELPSTENTQRRLENWEKRCASHAISRAALRTWLAESPLVVIEANSVELDEPLVWDGHPMTWPPESERELLLKRTQRIVGDTSKLDNIPELKNRSYRQLAILRRRAAFLALKYVSDGPDLEERNRLLAYLAQDVARPWKAETAENFKTRDEEAAPERGGAHTVRTAAAVLAMVTYEAFVDWKILDTRAIVESLTHTSSHPAQTFRSGIATVRRPTHLDPAPEKQPMDHYEQDRYVSTASSPVLRLFQKAEELRAKPLPTSAQVYIDARRALASVHSGMTIHDRHVVLFADLIANLAVANHKINRRLPTGQAAQFRGMLKHSASLAENSIYRFFQGRDAAITLQGERHELAVHRGQDTLGALREEGQKVKGNKDDTRRYREVEQQLALSVAGSSVQLLEEHLSEPPYLQNAQDPREWQFMLDQVMAYADVSIALIENMHIDGDLSGQRFESKFFSDASFLFRSHEIYYRCVCVAATTAWAFGSPRSEEFPELLTKIHRATVALSRPFSEEDMGRILPSMIWHSFLAGNRLPALQYSDNRTLFNHDPISRVLLTSEEGDPRAALELSWKRLDVLTSQLIAAGKHAGPLGRVAEGSKVWQILDERSDGVFARWRNAFGPRLLPPENK